MIKSIRNQQGFSIVEILLVAIVLAVVGGIGWRVLNNQDSTPAPENQAIETVPRETEEETIDTDISWSFRDGEWLTSGAAPECPAEPYLQTPTDLSKVTGILYPGQYRGNEYKSHGGFRFDNNKTQAIDVTIPMDANLIAASRYVSSIVSGEPQYFMIFIAPCGIMYRIDHVTKFSDKFQTVMDTLPEAKVDDSRTTDFNPPIAVTAGELLGVEVGFPGNVFFDFGVNDLRAPNEQSKDSAYAGEHKSEARYNYYGVCWFDLLPEADAAIVKALPAGGNEGKVSDYC